MGLMHRPSDEAHVICACLSTEIIRFPRTTAAGSSSVVCLFALQAPFHFCIKFCGTGGNAQLLITNIIGMFFPFGVVKHHLAVANLQYLEHTAIEHAAACMRVVRLDCAAC